MDTEHFNPGDAVTAVIRRNGIKNIQGTVFAATSTHVSIDTAEGPFLANIEDVKRAADRSLEKEAATHDFLVFANKAQQEDEAIQQMAQLITDSVNSGESKEEFEAKLADMLGVEQPVEPAVVNALPPPVEKPKKERIRRTKEEIALGIPPEQVLAFREKGIAAVLPVVNPSELEERAVSNANAESKTFLEGLGEELNPSEETGVELSGNTGTLEAPAEDELMPRMELDALQPEVYNYDVMGPMPDGYVLARERFNGIRWYVMYFKLLKKLAYLPGTTSVEDNTSQPPAYLTKWRYDMVARYNDVNAMEGFVDDTAAYGTIMHTLIAWYINGSLPSIGSQSWKDQVCMLITLQDGRIPDIYYPLWDRRLRKDLTCWNQFMIERNVKVHMMEYACGSIGLGVAGQIDLVCTMDFNRGRVNAIIDMKSGKKSTGQGNSKATQLGIYKLIFDEVFPDWKYSDTDKSPMGITKFFNWHPSDYNETPNKETGLVTPTFELVNQTDSVDFVEVGLQMQLFRHRTQGLKPGSNARFTIEGDLKPFADNQTLIKGGQRKDTYIEKYNLEVAADD